MASTINADNGVVSGTSGIKLTSDSSGVLAIQSSGTTTATFDTSGNLTITGGLTAAGSSTLSGGTANGVLYLNGSKAVTSGSALVFDGTYFNLGASASSTGTLRIWNSSNDKRLVLTNNGTVSIINSTYGSSGGSPLTFQISDSEVARFDTSGNLGLGTSSPISLGAGYTSITVNNATTGGGVVFATGGVIKGQVFNGGNAMYLDCTNAAGVTNFRNTSTGAIMQFDYNGNLGLGVTPSAWENSAYQVKAIQVGQGGAIYGFNASSHTNDMVVSSNAYVTTSGASKYINSGYAMSYQMTSGQHQWLIAGSGSAGGTVSFTQAMTLNNSGQLGIGTTSPSSSAPLTINNTSGGSGMIMFQNGSYSASVAVDITSGNTIASSPADSLCLRSSGGPMLFSTGGSGTEVMRIDNSGTLFVGKTSSAATSVGFQVDGTGALYTTKSTSTSADATYYLYSTGAGAYRFYVGMDGTIHATSTSITAISDQTLKTNVKPLETGLTQVMALQPRRFDWINGDATNVAGFIAQEVEQVLPDLVAPFKYTDTETKLGLKMGDMIPTLVKAIQELKAELDTLKAKVGA